MNPTTTTGSDRKFAVETEDDGVEWIVNQIKWVITDPAARDEDEPAPSQHVADNLIMVVKEAGLLTGALPPGDVSSFYGELSVTWRTGNRIVSVICTASAELRVHSGTISESPAEENDFRSIASASDLAERLDWMKQAVLTSAD